MRQLPYRSGRTSGKASPIVVAVLVIIAAVAVMLAILMRPGDDDSEKLTPEQAEARFTELHEEIDAAIQNNRDLTSYIEEVDAVVERMSEPAPAYVLLAQMLMKQNRDEEAIATFAKALKAEPNQPEVALLVGTLAFQHKKYDQALGFYQHVLQHEKNNTRARLHLGSAHLKLGEYDAARNVLLEALTIDSNLHRAHAILASVYAAQNKTALADDQIVRAIDLLGSGQEAMRVTYVIQRSQILRRANQPDDALSVLSDLPPQTVLTAPVLSEMAICYAMKGEPKEAAKLYEQALVLRPLDKDALAKAAAWRIKAEQPDRAREHMEALRKIDATYPDLTKLEENLRELTEASETADERR